MRRFVIDAGLLAQEEFDLPPDEARHATKVLRLAVGDEIELIDGLGARAMAEITAMDKRRVGCRVARRNRALGLKPNIVLCPALIKPQAMELAVVKLTELGVNAIRPFVAERSVTKARKIDRWQRLALQALKQCGAPLAPEIHPPLELNQLLELVPTEAGRIMLYEKPGGLSLSQAMRGRADDEIWLLIGPEGGFTPAEAAMALEAGFTACHLPDTILRAETACIAGAALLRFGPWSEE